MHPLEKIKLGKMKPINQQATQGVKTKKPSNSNFIECPKCEQRFPEKRIPDHINDCFPTTTPENKTPVYYVCPLCGSKVQEKYFARHMDIRHRGKK